MYTNYKLLLLIIGFPFAVFSQTHHGFSFDNYSGIYSTIGNPANAVESKHRLHFNGISYNNFRSTDLGEIDFIDLKLEKNPNGFNGITYPEDITSVRDGNFSVSNTDVLLPSVLWNFHPKHALGLLWRYRNFSNYNCINGLFWNDVNNDFSESTAENSNLGPTNFNNTSHSWNEIGLNYGVVLLNTNYHFVKFGGTAKLLVGNRGVEFRGSNLNGGYNASAAGDLTLTSGEITYLNTTLENTEPANDPRLFLSAPFANISFTNLGFGGDVGLIYEWRPRETNNVGVRNNASAVNTYKLKLSASILDMGRITYAKSTEDAVQNTFTINPSNNAALTIPKSEVRIIGFISALRNANTSENNNPQQGAVSFALPRSLNLGLDYILFNDKNYYINLNYVMPLTDKEEEYANSRAELITLTPRFETRKFSAYLPISYGSDAGLFFGAGLRYGPFTIGTSAAMGLGENMTTRHIYAGIHLPLLNEVFR